MSYEPLDPTTAASLHPDWHWPSSPAELIRHALRALKRYEIVGWREQADSIGDLIRKSEAADGVPVPELRKWLARAASRAARHEPPIIRKSRPEGPAERYSVAANVCVVTCFFNPCGYRSRVRNFEIFAQSLTASGVAWRGIECAFGDQPFTLPEYSMVTRVRSSSILWQKERLINLAVSRLPDVYTKIAWIDADVLFGNPHWIVEAGDALDQYQVVQPFSSAASLGPDFVESGIDRLPSFAYLYHQDPDGVLGPAYWNHGHTGYAWAGRREWIERYGLYDACLSGTGDHLMAHGFVGDWRPGCLGIGTGPAYKHLSEWCLEAYPEVSGSLGYVDGTAYSLWHGPVKARDYYGAVCKLKELKFDPYVDIALGPTGCWEWSTDRRELHEWTRGYFARRREDG